MFHWFKKHFIPHEDNNHRPHLLRESSIKNIIVIVLFLEIITFLIPTLSHINITGGMAAVLPAILSDLTNSERQTQNLKTLTVSPVLNKAAEMKALDMATNSYFAHTSPEGKTPWYWLEKVGYKYQYAGENLAVNFSDSKDVTNAWMKSPTHKANIIKGNYTEVGTGIANGLYQGVETVFVVQVYANPLLSVKIIEPTNTEAKTIKEVSKIEPPKEEINILGAEVVADTENITSTQIQNSTFWQKILASPRNTMNIILFAVLMIIAFALALYMFIKIKHYHFDLITNGLIVLAILGVIFVGNYYWSNSQMVVSKSFDYSVENK